MLKNFKNFSLEERTTEYWDLSEMDQKKLDVILRSAKKRHNFYQVEIDTVNDYLNDYKLSDTLKSYLTEELEHLVKMSKSWKKYINHGKDKD